MYKPAYEKPLQTRTETVKVETVHRDGVDWDYPFDAECDHHLRQAEVRHYLSLADEHAHTGRAYVTTDGGSPRFGWRRVIGTAMVSKWPYWTCRPCVLVESQLGGSEWYDWASLTGAELRSASA